VLSEHALCVVIDLCMLDSTLRLEWKSIRNARCPLGK
jgi:hypothetical protein